MAAASFRLSWDLEEVCFWAGVRSSSPYLKPSWRIRGSENIVNNLISTVSTTNGRYYIMSHIGTPRKSERSSSDLHRTRSSNAFCYLINPFLHRDYSFFSMHCSFLSSRLSKFCIMFVLAVRRVESRDDQFWVFHAMMQVILRRFCFSHHCDSYFARLCHVHSWHHPQLSSRRR